jgi:RNA polymerase sigma factor (sigma-70 family)
MMRKDLRNEIDLLKASVAGNSGAFEDVVIQYQSLVCAITYSATGNIERSEELAQETFVKAWRDISQLKDLAKFKAWLCAIARTTIQGHFRRSQRDPLKNSVSIDTASDTPSDQLQPIDAAISKEQQTLVDGALQQLPEEYRQPLILFYRCEQSTKAVSQALDLSENSVRQRLHRGRKMLKNQLSGLIETTLSRTAPNRTFTTAVMASVAALSAKTAITAATAAGIVGASTASTGVTTVTTAVVGTLTAKLITAAAVIAMATGVAVTYKHMRSAPSTQDANSAVAASVDQQSAQSTGQSVMPGQDAPEMAASPVSVDMEIDAVEPAPAQQTIISKQGEADAAPHASSQTLKVKVIDRQTLLPLSNAKVRTYPKHNPNHYVTDATGVATIDFGKVRPTNLNLFVGAGDYTPMSISFNPSTMPVVPADFQFELSSGIPITGHVQKHSDGTSIEGALIKVGYMPHDATHTVPRFDLRDCEHVTGEDGNWTCYKTPEDLEDLSVSVTHPDFAEKRLWHSSIGKYELAKRYVHAIMTPGYNITGVVMDPQGIPIRNASVYLGESRYFSGDEVLKTDSQGLFEFLHRTPSNDRAVVSVQADGYAPELLSLDMTPDLSPSEIILTPAETLSLRVVDIHGNPIKRAKINLGKWRDYQSLKFLGTIDPDRFKYTDSTGRFKWTNAPADEIEMVIGKKGYMYFSKTPLMASAEEHEITLYRPIHVSGHVIDAETRAPIEQFKLIPGIESIGRPGNIVFQSSVGWLKACTNGKYAYDFTSPGLSYGIQIVAEGYVPAFSETLYGDQQDVSLDFKLQRGVGPTGFVSTRGGKAVQDAQVCLVTGHSRVENGQIYNKRYQIVTASDANGLFSFAAQNQAYPIMALADEGFAYVTVEEFAQTNEIVLEPWARVTGDFYVGTKPAQDKLLRLSCLDAMRHNSGITGENNAVTDKEGIFSFDKVIPGRVRLYRETYEVEPGQTLELNLGGHGRTVIGKVTGPEGQLVFGSRYYSDIGIHSVTNEIPAELLPRPDDFERMTYTQTMAWFAEFAQTQEAQDLGAKIEAYQGSSQRYSISYGGLFAERPFTVENVPPGRYVYRGRVRSKGADSAIDYDDVVASLYYGFEVPDFTEDTDFDTPLDLGVIEMKQGALDIGTHAPDFEIAGVHGGSISYSDYIGKTLLLTFYNPYQLGDQAEEWTFYKAIYDEHKGHADFEMLGVYLQMPAYAAIAAKHLEALNMHWAHGIAAQHESRISFEYDVKNLPYTVLIDSKGIVRAVDPEIDSLKEILRDSLYGLSN